MNEEKIAKLVKKLLYTNRYTLEDISSMLSIPIEKCVEAFEDYYKTKVPLDLFIVGNQEARNQLKQCVKNNIPALVVGPNGIGKSSSIRETAKFLNLLIHRIYPLKQHEIVKEFGRNPFSENNQTLFVIEADGLGAKEYAIMSEYIKNTKRPLVFIAEDKKKLNSNVVKKLTIINFSSPSPKEVEIFLKKTYNWEGKISEVYDGDMRLTLNRVLESTSLDKPQAPEYMDAMKFAHEASFGYLKKEDFSKLQQPIWWVLRALAYNQKLKFPTDTINRLKNLENLSYIDSIKFSYEDYIKQMVVKLKGSPRQGYFSFPPWGKKDEKIVEEDFTKLSKKDVPQYVPQEKPIVQPQFNLGSWL